MSEIHLADGTVLAGDAIGVVFNRLQFVALPHFAQATPEDRDYAVMETYALWLSWLAGLPCRVINPVTPRGLGGAGRSPVEWLCLAGRAGLPTQTFFFSSDPRAFRRDDLAAVRAQGGADWFGGHGLAPVALPQVSRQPTYFLERLAQSDSAAVLVAGEQLVGGLAEIYAGPLRGLAALAGCDLLQVNFGRTEGGEWRVQAVSAFPLTTEPFWLRVIVELLEARCQR